MKLKEILIIFLLVLLDQITKILCIKYLKPIDSFKIIENFFYLSYVENEGAAFGIFQGARYIFIILTILVLIFCFYYYGKIKVSKFSIISKISFILVISGAIGNLIDRAFKGYVVDMFHFIFFGNSFAVFNIADIFVVCGTILFVLIILFNDTKKDKGVL